MMLVVRGRTSMRIDSGVATRLMAAVGKAEQGYLGSGLGMNRASACYHPY